MEYFIYRDFNHGKKYKIAEIQRWLVFGRL
jgi:hypothetical protein